MSHRLAAGWVFPVFQIPDAVKLGVVIVTVTGISCRAANHRMNQGPATQLHFGLILRKCIIVWGTGIAI